MAVDVPNITNINDTPFLVPLAQALPDLGSRIKLAGAIDQIGYGAVLNGPTTVLLLLGFVPRTVNTTAGNYTIGGPTSITVNNVVYNPGDTFITVTTNASFPNTGNYTITLAENTYFDSNGNFNPSGPTPIIRPSSSSSNPPQIVNVTPAVGTPIRRDQTIGFDIIDDNDSFRQIIILARYPNPETGLYEVIHDGLRFGPMYASAANQRSTISGGFRFVVVRDGGWPQAPVITPYAIDTDGGENP